MNLLKVTANPEPQAHKYYPAVACIATALLENVKKCLQPTNTYPSREPAYVKIIKTLLNK